MEITVDGVVYDVVKEKEITDCRGCFLCGFTNGQTECFEITNVDCIKEKVIFVKIPIELLEKIEQLEKQIEIMMNCENCNGHSSLTCSGCKNYSNWHIKQGGIKSENNS